MDIDTAKRKEKKPHHGRNIRRARVFFDKNQEELAMLLNTNQKAVYNLEQQEIVDDKILMQVANIFNLPVEFFKKVQPDDMVQKYVLENNTLTVGDNALDSFNLNGAINNTITITGDAKYIKLCEDLSKVHEKVIKIVTKDLNTETAKNKKLEAELARVQKELEKYKNSTK
ncbi:hypothetical protein CLV62_1031 [Dysgonomonas alginatilytica]|uniref:HTH cro/C1-type domain-containing protein n=1 Tax=Dysgonomonas alginatilytica TaxID=1605892 RepID=A0A2V3PTV1_9BACT|nr:helix-turn-helix transcriptional regulator [Dysgonomonas alginatilytica]PXV67330.1 hypothetical protein CLV62_1031 [Dysgonomonas alginatilytica]